MLRRIAALPILALLGCGSTEPAGDPFDVTIGGQVTSTGYSTFNQRYECFYRLRLTASGGKPGDFATWDTGTTSFLYDEEGLDELRHVFDFWDRERIGHLEQLEAERIAFHPTKPFGLEHVIDFRMPDGSQARRRFALDC